MQHLELRKLHLDSKVWKELNLILFDNDLPNLRSKEFGL